MRRTYLLDTGVAQDLQDNRRDVRARTKALRRQGHRIGICIPTLGELWSGVEGSASRNENLKRLMHMLNRVVIWPYTAKAAEHYGQIVMHLRRVGRPMQQVDAQIGAIARTLNNCIVVSYDSDLKAIPNIVVENWASG